MNSSRLKGKGENHPAVKAGADKFRKERADWWSPRLKCSACLDLIGFGLKRQAAVLGVNTCSLRNQKIRSGGYRPKPMGWNKGLRLRDGRITDKDVSKAQAAAWNNEWRGAWPDWSYEWYKHKASKSSIAKYRAMSAGERKERNQRCIALRKAHPDWASPERKARDLEYKREWKIANRERVHEYMREWRSTNADRVRAIRRKLRRKPGIRARENCRKRLRGHIKSSSESFADSLGCSTKQLKAWLESQFTRRMSWQNYGTYWHIDHIQPLASFDLSDPSQRKIACNWANLRPLEAKRNMDKSDKIEVPQLHLCLELRPIKKESI